jgi:hypothetical protein
LLPLGDVDDVVAWLRETLGWMFSRDIVPAET